MQDPVSAKVDVRDAATVMLVRDAPTLQVFMLRRNLNSDFVGGAYVFPGGAVDPADREAHLDPVCAGRSDEEASDLLDIQRGGLAFWVAAIRECFEEAGVLLARHAGTGEIVDFTDPAVEERFAAHRAAVDAGERRLVEVAQEEGLVLDVAGIYYFSHWITPKGAPRRYDTRFFVTEAPPSQTPLHDNRETVASLWIDPADALERCARGEMELIFPTIRSLEAISRFEHTADLLAAARMIDDVPTIQPKIVSDSHGVRILLPGDDGYEEAVEPADGTVQIPSSMPGAVQ